MVPLSEEELRLLEQMERALVAEDPKLASTLRGTTLRATARRRALLAGGVFVLGVCVLMGGAVTQTYVVAIIGFVVMLASAYAYVALSSWRGQSQTPEQAPPTGGGQPQGLSVIQGGRTRKRSSKRSRGPGPRSGGSRGSSGSMMQRFEERWRRRRDQNGF